MLHKWISVLVGMHVVAYATGTTYLLVPAAALVMLAGGVMTRGMGCDWVCGVWRVQVLGPSCLDGRSCPSDAAWMAQCYKYYSACSDV